MKKAHDAATAVSGLSGRLMYTVFMNKSYDKQVWIMGLPAAQPNMLVNQTVMGSVHLQTANS
jgi:pyrroline-5-carboxylate reductase